MSSSAGRVLLIPKGAYSAGTAYTPLDYVTYTDGNTYQCIKDTTGHAPTDTTYWKIMVDNSGTLHTSDIANNLTTQTAGKVLDASQGYALNNSLANKADQTDLASIHITGSTNNTGSTITAGTYFYKDGALVRAKADIANGATLTVNTNYEAVTAGGLNSINALISSGWKQGTLTPLTGITINTTYSFLLYHPVLKIAILQLYVTANTNGTPELVSIDVAPKDYKQYWGQFCVIGGGSNYSRAIVMPTPTGADVVLNGPVLTGYCNMMFPIA